MKLFSDAGLTVASVNSVAEAFADPQVLHRHMVVDVPSPSLGPDTRIKMAGIPVKYSDPSAQPSVRLPPPLLGEHTDEVLRDVLGRSAEQIAQLRQAGALG